MDFELDVWFQADPLIRKLYMRHMRRIVIVLVVIIAMMLIFGYSLNVPFVTPIVVALSIFTVLFFVLTFIGPLDIYVTQVLEISWVEDEEHNYNYSAGVYIDGRYKVVTINKADYRNLERDQDLVIARFCHLLKISYSYNTFIEMLSKLNRS